MSKGKLAKLKSHNHHVLIQQIMPAAVRNLLKPGPKAAIIKIECFFTCLCSKVIDRAIIPDLMECAAEALCLFEMWFSLRFFDIITHLLVHLVEELYWCGPIHACWCYLVECFMGLIVKFFRDRSSPKASMAAGYNIDEALGFCIKYFKLYPHSKQRIWNHNEEMQDSSKKIISLGKSVTLNEDEMNQIHDYVIKNSVYTAKLYG